MTDDSSSVGLYVHIPFCQRKCPYCAFYSVPIGGRSSDKLVDALLKEIDLYEITEPIETIYIGGGSPTCLPHGTLLRLLDGLKQRFGSVKEYTIECNPAQVDLSLFEQLCSIGVTRISIGAQSFDATELKMLNRIHSPEQIIEAVSAAHQAGFNNIGLDLIFGLPNSNLMAWQNTLERGMSQGVQHISAYSLTIEKDTPFERAAQQGELTMIDEAVERTMYDLACIQLQGDGFRRYEISNFARQGFECRHNMRYWKNLPVVGIGPAAASWYRRKRTMNVHDVDTYIDAVEGGWLAHVETHMPSVEQFASETAVLNLRMKKGVDLAEYKRLTGFDLLKLYSAAIQKNYDLGFLEWSDTEVYLSDLGLSFADAVAADFTIPD